MATKKKDPCPAGKYWNGKKCVTGQDPYKYKNKMVDTGAYWDKNHENWDSKKYREDMYSDDVNTNLKDEIFYNSMGPVEPGFVRAKFKPSFPNPEKWLQMEEPIKKKGGSVRTKKTKMAMGGTKETVIKKPLKTTMKTKCMSCGGSMKKMQLGGLANLIKKTVKKITRPKPKTQLSGKKPGSYAADAGISRPVVRSMKVEPPGPPPAAT